MSNGKQLESGTGIDAAEKYAKFFLRHPSITIVYIFSSVALLGDGNDVDMLLEVSDRRVGLEFLREVDRYVRNVAELVEGYHTERIPEVMYEKIKHFRHATALAKLGWNGLDDQTQSEEFRNIGLAGRASGWINPETSYETKLEIASKFRPVDLFLMPSGWKNDDEVRALLPMRNSKRPWSQRGFYKVLRLQSRQFDPDTGHFKPREPRTWEDERFLEFCLREESERRGPNYDSLALPE